MTPEQARQRVCWRYKDPIEIDSTERFGPAVKIVVPSTGEVLATVYREPELSIGETRDLAWQTAAFAHQSCDLKARTPRGGSSSTSPSPFEGTPA